MLVTPKLGEFEKQPVEVQDFRKITDHSRGIYRIHLKWMKANRKMSTCNRLDLESLGSWPTIYAQKLLSRALVYNTNGGTIEYIPDTALGTWGDTRRLPLSCPWPGFGPYNKKKGIGFSLKKTLKSGKRWQLMWEWVPYLISSHAQYPTSST